MIFYCSNPSSSSSRGIGKGSSVPFGMLKVRLTKSVLKIFEQGHGELLNIGRCQQVPYLMGKMNAITHVHHITSGISIHRDQALKGSGYCNGVVSSRGKFWLPTSIAISSMRSMFAFWKHCNCHFS